MKNIIYYALPGQFITVIIDTALFNFLISENNWIYVYFDTSLIYCEFVIDGKEWHKYRATNVVCVRRQMDPIFATSASKSCVFPVRTFIRKFLQQINIK